MRNNYDFTITGLSSNVDAASGMGVTFPNWMRPVMIFLWSKVAWMQLHCEAFLIFCFSYLDRFLVLTVSL